MDVDGRLMMPGFKGKTFEETGLSKELDTMRELAKKRQLDKLFAPKILAESAEKDLTFEAK